MSVIENPKGGRKLLPPPIFIATDVPPPKSKGNQTSLFQIMEAGKKVIIYEKFQIENDKLLFFLWHVLPLY